MCPIDWTDPRQRSSSLFKLRCLSCIYCVLRRVPRLFDNGPAQSHLQIACQLAPCILISSGLLDTSAKLPSAYSVPSVASAMMALELLAHSQTGFTLFEIYRKLGVAKSSAHVLMRTLEGLVYLKRIRSNE